jgi:hypothetical protein
MNIRALTKEEFIATFAAPMKDITSEAVPVVDIWPYVENVFAQEELPQASLDKVNVGYVYLTGDDQHHHVLVGYEEPNIYLAIVVDLEKASVQGHHLLDLNQEYGLSKSEI